MSIIDYPAVLSSHEVDAAEASQDCSLPITVVPAKIAAIMRPQLVEDIFGASDRGTVSPDSLSLTD